jgi:hypothetical protein
LIASRPFLALAVASVVAAGGCTSAEPLVTSDSELVGDAKSITANGDGTFDVACKDGTREAHVSAADIVGNRICNPPPPPVNPPAPEGSWSKAQHLYAGQLYGVTADDHYAFVDFDGVGFGRFDLRTYTLTTSYGSSSDYARWLGTKIYTRGTRVLLLKNVSFPGTTATGLQVDLRDLADTSFVYTVTRPPTPGAGNLLGRTIEVCVDGRAQWREGNTYVTATVAGGAVSVAESATSIECAPAEPPAFVEPYRAGWHWRSDLQLIDGALKQCVGAVCTVLRAMPSGTAWATFSKSGQWVAYEANGFVYRDKVGGGALTTLPYEEYKQNTRNTRDGKLLTASKIYDIDKDVFTSLGTTFSTGHGIKYLPNGGMALFMDNPGYGYKALLVNDSNETVVVDTFLLNFSERRPGLEGGGQWLL